MTSMNVEHYLSRLSYKGKIEPGLDVLFQLQAAHLYNIPFENLDIHNKIPIDLYNSYQKIIVGNRGGFCYELNSVFYLLLKALGYNVKLISARVFGANGYGQEFDHMAIIARIGSNDYLVDVGFGEFALQPLRIEFGVEQNDPRGKFKIEKDEEGHLIVVKKNEEGKFIPEYKFSLIERKVEDFLSMCEYHQTSPQSHFTQKRICSLATKEGRISLSGHTLKITVNGELIERQLTSESEVEQVLKEYFRIELHRQPVY